MGDIFYVFFICVFMCYMYLFVSMFAYACMFGSQWLTSDVFYFYYAILFFETGTWLEQLTSESLGSSCLFLP